MKRDLTRKESSQEVFETINKASMKWFLNLRSENIPVNRLLHKVKDSYFAKELWVPNFQAFDGWLEKWKRRQFDS